MVLTLAIATSAQASNEPSWATLQQWADKEVKAGGVYSRSFGDASPRLKWISAQMIYKAFGRGWVGKKMLCYANRESGMNVGALSSTNDHHLFQLNYSAHHTTIDFARLDRFDVGYGITAAYKMSKGGRDFRPWAGGSHNC